MNRVYQSLFGVNKNIQFLSKCSCTTQSSSGSYVPKNAPGLSKKVINVPSGEVGFPRASKQGCYKNPEYFSYHNMSFYEAEVEVLKHRLPQPSNKAQK